jgi:hypothetical protein
VWPYQTGRDGRSFIEWERVEHSYPCDTVIDWEGQRWRVGTGEVFRHRKQWWMKHWAHLIR